MRIDGNKMSYQRVAPIYWGNLLFSKGFPAPVDLNAAGKQLTNYPCLFKQNIRLNSGPLVEGIK